MIIWIHGAFASKDCFNFMTIPFDEDKNFFIEYDTENNLVDKIHSINDFIRISFPNQEVKIVGHSLGGIIATIVARMNPNVQSLATISAPFGGITSNPCLKFMFPKSIFSEFSKVQMKFNHLLFEPSKIPHANFISTKGANPMFFGVPNDGVVTVESQRKVIPSKTFVVHANHYEILMNREVREELQNFLV